VPRERLDKLGAAFLLLKKRDRVKNLKLRVGGSCGPTDQVVVDELRGRLEKAGVAGDVEFVPNPSRDAKLDFLRTLSVFSVPATYNEAFGLYLIEALASASRSSNRPTPLFRKSFRPPVAVFFATPMT